MVFLSLLFDSFTTVNIMCRKIILCQVIAIFVECMSLIAFINLETQRSVAPMQPQQYTLLAVTQKLISAISVTFIIFHNIAQAY